MVDRIRYPTVSYLPFYYVFFQFLLLTIFNLQANILTTKDILSNLVFILVWPIVSSHTFCCCYLHFLSIKSSITKHYLKCNALYRPLSEVKAAWVFSALPTAVDVASPVLGPFVVPVFQCLGTFCVPFMVWNHLVTAS